MITEKEKDVTEECGKNKIWHICKYMGIEDGCRRENDDQCPKLIYKREIQMVNGTVFHEGEEVNWLDKEYTVLYGNHYVETKGCNISVPIVGWFLYSVSNKSYYPLSNNLYILKKDNK